MDLVSCGECHFRIEKLTHQRKPDANLTDLFNTALAVSSRNVDSSTKIIIVLDSIDQLDTGSRRSLDWLPVDFPDNIILLISVISGDPDFQETYNDLTQRFRRSRIFEIQPLSENEIHHMVEFYLK